MHEKVAITHGPLMPAVPLRSNGAGAVICFEGIVRGMEAGRPLEALDYEVYEPMTLRELIALSQDIVRRHKLLGIVVEHSEGRVRVGEISFRLQVAAKHRAEGLAAVNEFIDRLKQEVPLWKVPVFAEDMRVKATSCQTYARHSATAQEES